MKSQDIIKIEPKTKKQLDNLLRESVILLILSTICTVMVIRGELIGEKDILYALGGILGVLFATLAGMLCFYILGVKEGIKITQK